MRFAEINDPELLKEAESFFPSEPKAGGAKFAAIEDTDLIKEAEAAFAEPSAPTAVRPTAPTPEEDEAPIIRKLKSYTPEAAQKTASLFNPEVDKLMAPTWQALADSALKAGYFGDKALGSDADTSRQQYEKVRETMARDFNLNPIDIDDLVKHRMGAQKEGISRDALGVVHIKDDLLVKGADAIEQELKGSPLPLSVKNKVRADLPQRLEAFKGSVLENVKQNHPEFAATLDFTGDTEKDYATLNKELNKTRKAQLAGGLASYGAGRVASISRGAAGAMESELAAARAVSPGLHEAFPSPDLETGMAPLDARTKRIESANELSNFINQEKVRLFGTDAATIGQGIASAVESVALGALTGGAGTAAISADRIAKAGKAGAAALKLAQGVMNTAPIAGMYGLDQAISTYEQAKETGMSDDDAARLSALSGAIEFGTTAAFGGTSLSGLEAVGSKLVNAATRREIGKSVARAWGELGYDVAKGLVGENLEEGIITALDTLAVQAEMNPNLTVGDLKKSLYDTMVATTISSGPMTTVGAISEQGRNLLKSEILLTPETEQAAPASTSSARKVAPPTAPQTDGQAPAQEAQTPVPVQEMPEQAPGTETVEPGTVEPGIPEPLTPQTDATGTTDDQQERIPTGEGRPPAETSIVEGRPEDAGPPPQEIGGGAAVTEQGLDRETLKATFNLTDEQADAAQQMSRALGLTPEQVLLEREVSGEPVQEMGVPLTRPEEPVKEMAEIEQVAPTPTVDSETQPTLFDTPRQRSLSSMRAEVLRKLDDPDITPAAETRLTALLGRIEGQMRPPETPQKSIRSEDYDGPRWTYGLRARPLDIGTAPKDFIIGSNGPAMGRSRHGTIQYARELTPEEIYNYELEAIPRTADEPKAEEPVRPSGQSGARTQESGERTINAPDTARDTQTGLGTELGNEASPSTPERGAKGGTGKRGAVKAGAKYTTPEPDAPTRSRRLTRLFGPNFEGMLMEAQELFRRNDMPKRQAELRELLAMLIANKGFGAKLEGAKVHHKIADAMVEGKPNLVDKVLRLEDIPKAEITKSHSWPSVIGSVGYELEGNKYVHPSKPVAPQPAEAPEPGTTKTATRPGGGGKGTLGNEVTDAYLGGKDALATLVKTRAETPTFTTVNPPKFADLGKFAEGMDTDAFVEWVQARVSEMEASDPNIGREWDSPYGRQRIRGLAKDGGAILLTDPTYEVESVERPGEIRRYSAKTIEDTIKSNEYALSPEAAADRAQLEESSRMAEQRAKDEAAEEEAAKQRMAPYLDATTKTPLQRGKKQAALMESGFRRTRAGKEYRGNKFDAIRALLDDGYLPTTAEVPRVKDITSRRYNRMDAAEQIAFERRRREAGTRTEYYLEKEGSRFVVTKTEYDLANWMVENPATGPTPEWDAAATQAGLDYDRKFKALLARTDDAAAQTVWKMRNDVTWQRGAYQRAKADGETTLATSTIDGLTEDTERFQEPAPLTDAEYNRHAELEARKDDLTPEELAEAQTLVEKAAAGAGYTERVYHGTKAQFNEFRPTEGSKAWYGEGIYVTRSRAAAAWYAGETGRILDGFAKVQNPKQVSARDEVSSDQAAKFSQDTRDAGFDAIEVTGRDESANEVILFYPSQIKSADPFTGVPLRERFNPESPDIRYQSTDGGPAGATARTTILEDGRLFIEALPGLKPGVGFAALSEELIHAWELSGFPGATDEDVATLKRILGSKTPGRDKFEYPETAKELKAIGGLKNTPSEKLASNWLQYLTEGKAPTEELQGLFTKIAKWMVEAYRAIPGLRPDIKIHPELRAIFDKIAARMENPSSLVSPTGVTMETVDGSPLPPAIPATPENFDNASTPEDIVGLVRGIIENQSQGLPPIATDAPPLPPIEPPTGPTEDWNPENLFSLQERAAYEQSDEYKLDKTGWEQAARSFGTLWKEAMAKPPGYGSALLDRIINEGNPDRVLQDWEIAQLTHEGLRRKVEVDKARAELDTALTENPDPAAVTEAETKLQTALSNFQTLHNVAAYARTASGRSLNAWKYALRNDFSYATLQTLAQARLNAVLVSNGNAAKPLPAEEEKKIAKYAEEQQARQRELERLETVQGNPDLEARLAEAEAMIEALVKEAKGARKKTAVQDATKRILTNRVRKAAAEARARLSLAPDPNIRYQAPTPENDPRWYDRALIMAEYLIVDPAMSAARFADLVRQRLGSAYAAVADTLRIDAQKSLKAILDDITGDAVPSAAEIVETVDPEQELTRDTVYELARAHVHEGARNTEVLDRVFADLAPLFPALTRENVAQLFTDYGRQRKLDQDEEAKALRAARSLELVQRQIDDLESRGQMKRTGRGKDEPSPELRELRKKRDDLAKRIGYVPVDPETNLSSAQSAAKKRMNNEMEELQRAIDTGIPRVRVRRGVEYTEDMETLRERLQELRKTYEDTFGTERTPEERTRILLKDLDRRIAMEESLIDRGLLAEENAALPPLDSPEITARREKLKALRKQKFELYDAANPNKRALAQAMKEAEAAVARRQALLDRGAAETPARRARGEGVNPTEALQALWKAADALDVLIAEIRRNRPLTPAQRQAQLDRAYDAAVATRETLRTRIENGDILTPPRTKAEVEPRTRAIREENAALRKQITQMQKDAGVGAFSEEAREDRLNASLEKRLAEIKRMREQQEFEKKPRREPVTSERIRALRTEIEVERMRYEEARAQYAYTQLGLKDKVLEGAVSLYMARQVFNLSGDFGIFGRQLGKAKAKILVTDVVNVWDRLRKGEPVDLKQGTIIGQMLGKGIEAFGKEKTANEAYYEIVQDPRYEYFKRLGFYLAKPHETSHELTSEGRVRLNPTVMFNNKAILAVMILRGVVKTAASLAVAKATFGVGAIPLRNVIIDGIKDTLMGTALAIGGVEFAKRVERAQTTMLNVARWELTKLTDQAMATTDPEHRKDTQKKMVQSLMTMTGRLAGDSGFTRTVSNNAWALGLLVAFPQYKITNLQAAVGWPLLRTLIGKPETRTQAAKYTASLYGYWMAGYAAQILIMAAIFGAWDDEDESKEENFMGVITNWRNPNFGKLRVGKTYIDFNPGASTWWVDFVRLFGDEKMDPAALREGREIVVSKTARDNKDAWLNFLSKQIQANIRTVAEATVIRQFREGGDLRKMDVINQTDLFLNEIVMNLTLRDMGKIYDEHGPVKGAAIASLLMTGQNVTIRETGAEKAERRKEERQRERTGNP